MILDEGCAERGCPMHDSRETKGVVFIRKEWVGLSDEEVYPLANEHLHYQMEGYEVSGVYNLARAIEAKLKEKNT